MIIYVKQMHMSSRTPKHTIATYQTAASQLENNGEYLGLMVVHSGEW